MLTPFVDFALSAGPMIGTIVIVALLATACLIAGLALRKSLKGRNVDISIMGRFIKVKVEDSTTQPSALPPGTMGAPADVNGGSQPGQQNRPINPAP
ncbi:hypothetical protein V1227_19120 [Lentzea sp. DG1S-22]|uniref:hypothetical protein n=1 Tax=Lentzea sp. DG1S-22 TaxID=3108822 RepID=UPI002E764559|nr:hypothetical protein [Lentzea sp. DG1S-22]WVH84759.1 hypothetical protein V1227_19120 [Lentzea sp. DG1S-22]